MQANHSNHDSLYTLYHGDEYRSQMKATMDIVITKDRRWDEKSRRGLQFLLVPSQYLNLNQLLFESYLSMVMNA
jgi:hypothetical protein